MDLGLLMVRSIESRNKEVRIYASFRCGEQGREDGRLIFKVVVQCIGCATGRITRYRYAVEAYETGIGYFHDQTLLAIGGGVIFGKDTIVCEKDFDGPWM